MVYFLTTLNNMREQLPKRYLDAGIYTQRFSADMWGVDSRILTNPARLNDIAQTVCEKLKLTVVGEYTHLFVPGAEIPGSTGIKVLSQSSVVWHDWAEHGYLAVDGHTCSDNVDLREAEEVLIEQYTPEAIDFQFHLPKEPRIVRGHQRFERNNKGIYLPNK